MRKRLGVLLLTATVLLTSSTVFAKPVGNLDKLIAKETRDDQRKEKKTSDEEIIPTKDIKDITPKAGETPKTEETQKNGETPKGEVNPKKEVSGNISFEDAVKMLNQNIDIKFFDKKIEVFTRKYEEAINRKNATHSKTQDLPEDIIEEQKDALLIWKQRENDLFDAKHQKENKLKALKIQVEKEFLDLTMAQEDIINMKTEISNLNTKIDEIALKIQVGQLNDIELKNLQAQRSVMNAQLSIATKNIENATIALKKDLGIDLNSKVTFNPLRKEYVKFDETDMKKKMEKECKEGYAVKKAKKDLETLNIEKDIYINYSKTSDPQELPTLRVSVANKEIDVEDIPTTTEATLWGAYYNLRNLEDNIEIEKINLESLERDVAVLHANITVGLAIETQEITARIGINEQKTKVQKAMNDYMKAKADFENSLTD